MSASAAVVFDLGGVVVTWDPEAIVASVFEDPSEQALALEGVFADPDWVELVTDLRDAGNRLLVLSNLHRASLAHLQSAHDLFGLFDGRIVSCEVGSCKLEAAIFSRLLTQYGLDPGACASSMTRRRTWRPRQRTACSRSGSRMPSQAALSSGPWSASEGVCRGPVGWTEGPRKRRRSIASTSQAPVTSSDASRPMNGRVASSATGRYGMIAFIARSVGLVGGGIDA